jgi:hypothetical protein
LIAGVGQSYPLTAAAAIAPTNSVAVAKTVLSLELHPVGDFDIVMIPPRLKAAIPLHTSA